MLMASTYHNPGDHLEWNFMTNCWIAIVEQLGKNVTRFPGIIWFVSQQLLKSRTRALKLTKNDFFYSFLDSRSCLSPNPSRQHLIVTGRTDVFLWCVMSRFDGQTGHEMFGSRNKFSCSFLQRQKCCQVEANIITSVLFEMHSFKVCDWVSGWSALHLVILQFHPIFSRTVCFVGHVYEQRIGIDWFRFLQESWDIVPYRWTRMSAVSRVISEFSVGHFPKR
jgi:hypothetical protein